MKMKSRTAIMNDRKRAAGLRELPKQWIIDVRGTEHETEFNLRLQALLAEIAGLSLHYTDKLKGKGCE
tara:strand:- start:4126 stop:4329 length:204 start_codon:yes stop_codon:yes gene_type:complete